MNGSRPSLATLVVALALWVPGAASAQSVESAPTRGVYQAGMGIADGPGPFAVAQNPAGMGDLRGFTLGLRHTETGGDATWSGRGTGLYLASPLPYVRRLQLGGAVELLRPALVPDGLKGFDGKLTLALSAQVLEDFLSLGLSYAHVFRPAEGDVPSHDLDTLDLGLRARGGPWIAASFVVHDVNAPRSSARPNLHVPRVYEAEVLGRPLRDDRLELAAGARFAEDGGIEPRLRLWARPVRGVALGAEGAMLLREGPPAFRVGLGVQLDFTSVGAAAYGLVSGDDRLRGGGGSVAVRTSIERYPSVTDDMRGQRLLRLEPSKLEGVAFLRALALLRQVESDRSYAGVILVLGGMSVGWARADELRRQLLRLRAAGKHVYAYGADYNNKAYFVATAAERIYLDPVGSLRVTGVATAHFFVKEALDLLGVRADLVRIGEYKSAPEMFTRSEPTPPATAQREALIAAHYEQLVGAVAAGRGMTRAEVEAAVGRGLFAPEAARRARLVDLVTTGEGLDTELETRLGRGVRVVGPPGEGPRRGRSWAPRTIAVINIEGDLTEGTSRTVPVLDMKMAGGDTLGRALEQASRDPQVEAIVLRIESPGGSALVADVLARQVAQLGQRKPVVCSLGDVAASGGYYLAAPCAQIFASPGTVTGSIGIFGGKVDASALLGRLGVRTTVSGRGPHADMEGWYRPYSEDERALLTAQLQAGYDRFVQVVATGRRMRPAEVDALGRGRVWSGTEAVRRRLCDREGGLLDAIAAARTLAGLSPGQETDIVYYPQQEPGLLRQLIGLLDLRALTGPGLPGVARLQELLVGLPAALLLLEGGALARLEGEVPR